MIKDRDALLKELRDHLEYAKNGCRSLQTRAEGM